MFEINYTNREKMFEETQSNFKKIEGIEDDATTKENVTLTITDDLKIVKTAKLNGEEIEFPEVFEEEGVYTIKVTDEAQNENEITFTIDKTKPVVEGLQSGKHYEEFTINVTDASEFTIEVEKNHKDTTEYENNSKFTEEGIGDILVPTWLDINLYTSGDDTTDSNGNNKLGYWLSEPVSAYPGDAFSVNNYGIVGYGGVSDSSNVSVRPVITIDKSHIIEKLTGPIYVNDEVTN